MLMKRILIFLVAALTILLCACSGDDSVLSESSAKKAIGNEPAFAKDFATKTFATGYYEIEEDYANKLAQLAAAGMITYNVDTFTKQVMKRNYGFWGSNYYMVEETHYFATVALTEEGNKYVVEHPTILRKDVASDFLPNQDYSEAVPDYMNASYNGSTAVVAEDACAVEEETAIETTMAEAAASEAVVEETEAPAAPANPNAAYDAAKARENKVDHQMLLGHNEIVKVKEVRCSEDMAKEGVGKCKLLYTFKDKTPFGYVLGAPKEGYINVAEISFVYYQDMGWVADNMRN